MNLSDKNRLITLKALLFLVFCLLAVSAGSNRNSSRETCNNFLLTSSQSVINEQAVPVSVNYSQRVIHEIEIPYFKSISGIRKAIIHSNLVRIQFVVLRKLLETEITQYNLFSYLSLLRVTQEDPPDLSQV